MLRLAAIVAVAALGLAGCGSSSADTDGAPSAQVTVTETAPPPDASSTEASSSTSTGTPSDMPSAGVTPPTGPIPLDSTIHDKGLGHTIMFEDVVRRFPAPKSSQALVDQGDELVLVKVKVTAGEKYYVTLGQDDFTFGVDGSDYPGMSMATPAIKRAMRKAGYPPLAEVDAGTSGEGWVAGFVRPAGSAKAYVAYHRLAYQVSGGGSIPAKTWKVTLPVG